MAIQIHWSELNVLLILVVETANIREASRCTLEEKQASSVSNPRILQGCAFALFCPVNNRSTFYVMGPFHVTLWCHIFFLPAVHFIWKQLFPDVSAKNIFKNSGCHGMWKERCMFQWWQIPLWLLSGSISGILNTKFFSLSLAQDTASINWLIFKPRGYSEALIIVYY